MLPIEDQCAHVKKKCPGSDSFLSIPYTKRYFCARPKTRPWIFAGLTVWLIFLFSTLGISASDFFCPNLATVAQTLGLDENVAGVTFLAFGNGSPDLFSTFSAMRSHTGSLAVGELFGAASFIVSCVVGSMCIIRPFKVERFPFLRDVGFFFTAVSLVIAVLWDGQLLLWESLLLVGLYFTYVCVVVVGSWWERRQEARRAHEALIRNEYSTEGVPEITYHDEEPYRDEPDEEEGEPIMLI
jgi:solute carrier family 24 (sodium/potassium/calcium exchanger), member 6